MRTVMLFDGRNYLAKDSMGKFTLTTDIFRAAKMNEKAAKNVIKHSLNHSKILSGRDWQLITVADRIELSEPEQEVKEVPVAGTPEAETPETESSDKEIQEERPMKHLDESELLQKITDGLEAYCELEGRRDSLKEKLHTETKLREDLEHIIENVRFNAFQGYDFCKKLQTISRSRRVTKKNVTKLAIIHDSTIFGDVLAIQTVLRRLKLIDNEDTYRYRAMTEFGETVQRGQTLSSKKG